MSRVVDLARPREPVAVEVVTSTASELLVLALVATERDPADYDVGAERIEALRDAAGRDLVEATRALVGGDARRLIHLLGHVVRAGAPYDVDGLLERLRSCEPDEVVLTLLGYHNRGARPTDAETMRHAVAGDADARRRLLDAVAAEDDDPTATEALMAGPAGARRDELVGILERWAEVLTEIEDEAREPIERDAAAKRQLASRLAPEELVEVATNGVEFGAPSGIRRLVLLPSYLLRPWVILSEYDDTRIVVHPVADEHLELDRSTPPPQLVKLYKALGDESRLRLLRRLAEGPISLREAADEIGIAKSTAHHHLAVLRQAGLVLVRADGDTAYSLRREELPRCNDLLVRYLGTGVDDERATAADGG